MTWEDIPGWYDWEPFYRRIVAKYTKGTFIEVGNYLGRSLCALGTYVKESKKAHKVIGVEWGLGSGVENSFDNHVRAIQAGGGTLAGLLHRNIIECGLSDLITLIIGDSKTCASLFPDNSVEVVFLDARHDYESVRADIEAWLPKIVRGGMLAGDDVGVPFEKDPIWPGVKQALDELLPGKWLYEPHDAWSYTNE